MNKGTRGVRWNKGSQVAERLGNWASNPKVAGSIHGQITLCPTLLASGECPCTYCESLWIRAAKM